MTRTADATSLETSLWVVANSSDDATALNLTRIYDVGGARPEMVDAALRTLIRRHEALRTGFEVSTDGTLVRRVHDDPPMDVRRIRIAEWDATETEHTIASATRLAAQHRFDLSHPPLMRATLLTLSEGRTLLLLTIHHIVADGWSFSVVEAEMTSLLRCTDLPPRPADADGEIFDRLIARERRERALSTFPAAFATRVAELEASVSPLQFGVLPGREVPNDVNAERLSIIIGDASAARMLRAARTYRTTLFGMILAAFGVLMYKLSGQRRLLVGVPISVREPSAADAVGLFANLLPISIHVQGDRRVADLVAATRDRLLDALEMPLMPFGELVRAVDPSGAGDAHPLCQVAVSWEEFGASRGAAFAATTLVPVTVPFAQSRFAVHVALYRSGGGIAGEILYRRDILDALAATRLVEGLEHLLVEMADAGDAVVGALRLCPNNLDGPPDIVDADGQPVPCGLPGFLHRIDASPADCARARQRPDGRVERLASPREIAPTGPAALMGDNAPPALARVVAAVWAELLSRNHIGLDENFFSIGGHSLLALQLAARLRDRLNVPVSPRLIYAAPTIRRMAASLHTAVVG
ncbi:hypothetical protein AVM11_11990 [Sphingomonas melonis TY]|jgi:hypothetical protein|uniref:Carrier domain-containing protein n=3 Tax=Sphingomonas TaxID=13687 RepID=A0A7Y7QX88_9SPHN|nr:MULTISPECIES: condensation domain-containing protein [Sphingomonas]KZB93581.1 hypothetical protein AVM11_11990 [Sphingomonas melonis TY]MBZ6383093.1 condensation domain-containing protein [Sphingomonas sanguinis]NNG48179.1 hypothetical protein [Sphingomonas sanguinis]NNG54925.1 hypothetical protein [Sphingomonas sanguinis]NVP32390.1 hypothetical protein [Sphingomonas sanguinis]